MPDLRTERRRVAPGALAALALILTLPLGLAGQKSPLDHDAYDIWRTIRGERISADGQWVLYHLTPRVGDTELVVTRRGQGEHRIPRGANARFSADSRFAVFTIRPAHDSVRVLRLAGTRRSDLPVDTLGILDLATGEHVRIPDGRSWRVPEQGRALVAYQTTPEPDSAGESGGQASGRKRPETRTLVIRDLATGEDRRHADVVDFVMSESGDLVAYTAAPADSAADGVYLVTTATGELRPVLSGPGSYTGLALGRDGRVAFLSDRADRGAVEPAYTVYAWTGGRGQARPVASPGGDGLPTGWWVDPDGSVSFSRDGRRLFFGSAPRPLPAVAGDSLLPGEQVRLDVWHWQDPHIQPMQLLNADRERKRTYRAVVHLDRRDQVVQLETPDLPSVRLGSEGDGDVGLAVTNVPYRALVGIESPGLSDLWLVNVRDGTRRKVVEGRQVGAATLSPGEAWVAWYDYEDRQWHGADTRRGRTVVLTAGIPYPLWNEDDDRPQHPGPYGRAGWTDGDREFLVYDRYDTWAVDPAGRASPRRVTQGLGREREIRLRYLDLDRDEPAIPRNRPLLFSAFHEATRDAGFFRVSLAGTPPEALVLEPKSFGRPVRADAGGALLFTREDVAEYPDLWVSGEWLEAPVRVSRANPQQAEYNWTTVELVDWRSSHGVPLQGLLYRPEDFDPARRYPMIVYFYERTSHNLHQHTPPLPHRSVIRPTFYASRGYVVFVPDIVYQEGYPGKSAMDAIMPAVLRLAEEPWVDETRVGVQGHSWGGYQIAYMVTQTNFFRAAAAGAPVANMTSAYGGIRWGTGLSRIHQYERTQSRIAHSLWERRDRYIENSPLFFLDRVETPLLIMHNDEDGAVPFEQGIELFMALRRLGKPAWLINYNDEPHWPTTAANIRDWNIRMQQYFDHFLKGAPAPAWLVEGIPATRKGQTLGLEPAVETAPGPITDGDQD